MEAQVTERHIELDVRLPTGATAPSSARALVGGLRDRLADDVCDDLVLVVSEVVTNCVRHAGLGPDDVIALRVRVTPAKVRLEVVDAGRGSSRPISARTTRPRRGAGALHRRPAGRPVGRRERLGSTAVVRDRHGARRPPRLPRPGVGKQSGGGLSPAPPEQSRPDRVASGGAAVSLASNRTPMAGLRTSLPDGPGGSGRVRAGHGAVPGARAGRGRRRPRADGTGPPGGRAAGRRLRVVLPVRRDSGPVRLSAPVDRQRLRARRRRAGAVDVRAAALVVRVAVPVRAGGVPDAPVGRGCFRGRIRAVRAADTARVDHRHADPGSGGAGAVRHPAALRVQEGAAVGPLPRRGDRPRTGGVPVAIGRGVRTAGRARAADRPRPRAPRRRADLPRGNRFTAAKRDR